jgi:four helix bundle protein
MRRCSISISSNIAEGFSRQSKKEKIQFYYISKGSLTEIQNQMLLAREIKYLAREEFDKLAQKTIIVSKLLTGLIKSLRK